MSDVVAWLADHSDLLNLMSSIAMVVIWVVYLQVFLLTYRRQSRNLLHLDLGAGFGTETRCLVSNMGGDPIYVQSIVADLGYEDGTSERAQLTERIELSPEEVARPLARTNRGPLAGGAVLDIGSIRQIIERARIERGKIEGATPLDELTVTVIAFSGQGQTVIGGAKTFKAERVGEQSSFRPTSVPTRQLGALRGQKALRDLLDLETCSRRRDGASARPGGRGIAAERQCALVE